MLAHICRALYCEPSNLLRATLPYLIFTPLPEVGTTIIRIGKYWGNTGLGSLNDVAKVRKAQLQIQKFKPQYCIGSNK